MATISLLANTVRPYVDCKLDDTACKAEKFSWQDPVHSWKAGPGDVMTVKNKQSRQKPLRDYCPNLYMYIVCFFLCSFKAVYPLAY